VMPIWASTTNSTRSAAATASRACPAIERVIGVGSAMSTPPVSTSRKRLPFHSQTSSLRSRVTPGSSCTTAARLPLRRLTSVDLPTFGKPTIATVPSRDGCGAAGSLIAAEAYSGGCALPVGERREQRGPRLRRHVLLAEHAHEADGLAELLQICRAAGADLDVAVEALALPRGEGAVEVVGDELDELGTREIGLAHPAS